MLVFSVWCTNELASGTKNKFTLPPRQQTPTTNQINILLMYVIRENFDHVGGTSTSVSGELRPNIENTRNERNRLRKTSKLVGSLVFLERLNYVNFFSINVEHLE